MRAFIFTLAALCVASCSSTHLTRNGRKVKIAERPNDVHGCKALGRMRVQRAETGMWLQSGRKQARKELRNRAASAGANRVLITGDRSHSAKGVDVAGTAYLCGLRRASTPRKMPTPAAAPLKLAVVPTQLDPSAADLPAEFFDEAVLTAVAHAGRFEVIGATDIGDILDFERQKDLLGCDDASCFAEIGGALGVPYLMSFRIARIDERWAVSSKIVDVRKIKVMRRETELVEGSTSDLIAGAPILVENLLQRGNDNMPANLREAVGGEPQPATEADAAPRTPVTPVRRTLSAADFDRR